MPPRSSALLCLWNTAGSLKSPLRPSSSISAGPISYFIASRLVSSRLPSLSISRSSLLQSQRTSFSTTSVAMTGLERLTERLEKPELDDRSYRVVRLPNNFEALLVHDPTTDKASASVNVKVGNFLDDDNMPGMAHAVEHLLFMGTEKVSASPTLPFRRLTPISIQRRMHIAST